MATKKQPVDSKVSNKSRWVPCEDDSADSADVKNRKTRRSSWYTLHEVEKPANRRSNSADNVDRRREKPPTAATASAATRRLIRRTYSASTSVRRTPSANGRLLQRSPSEKRRLDNDDTVGKDGNTEVENRIVNWELDEDRASSDDMDVLRSAYEQQLAQNTLQTNDTQRAMTGPPLTRHQQVELKRHRRSNSHRRRHSRSAQAVTSSTVFLTTPLRYRYKQQFHEYKYQSRSKSIIAPPLSLRTAVNYDNTPVLFRCDGMPKRQLGLSTSQDSGVQSQLSTINHSNLHTHNNSLKTSTNQAKTFIVHQTTPLPKMQKRNVRIQCNIMKRPKDDSQQGFKWSATGKPPGGRPVELRSIATQHDAPTPRRTPTVEMMNIDMTTDSTQTDIKTYVSKSEGTVTVTTVDNFVQCKPQSSSVLVQCLQPNVRNISTQSDEVVFSATKPGVEPIRIKPDSKHASVQCILNIVTQGKETAAKKSYKDVATEPLVFREAPTLRTTPRIDLTEELPLAKDIPIYKPRPIPRPHLYYFHSKEKPEVVRISQQKENNPPHRMNGQQLVLPRQDPLNDASYRGTSSKPPSKQYQGLYRVLTG